MGYLLPMEGQVQGSIFGVLLELMNKIQIIAQMLIVHVPTQQSFVPIRNLHLLTTILLLWFWEHRTWCQRNSILHWQPSAGGIRTWWQ